MRTVVVENAVVRLLATNPAAVARLPHILGAASRALKAAGPGCQTCQRWKAERRIAQVLSRTKQAIVAAGPKDRATLKSLLNADTLIVHHVIGGKTTSVTI